MQAVTVMAAIIAVTEMIKRYFPKVSGILTVVVAVIIGAVAGYFHVENLDIASGVVLGLGAVGIHTTATVVAERANTTTSN